MTDKNTSSKMDLWVEERHQDFISVRFRIDEVLYHDQSQYQQVDVVKTRGHGKMLMNDGLVMTTERDEHIYHEMIAHPALLIHPNPQKVLVVGGGDGGTAREVMRHSNVKKCRVVEIDRLVVEACKEHMPQTACGFDIEGVELSIADGVEFIESTDEIFDVIIVDSTDPIGPATPLFGQEFYQNVYAKLAEDGLVVAQGESPFYNQDTQNSLLKIASKIFPKCYLYNFVNMSYPGGLWSFVMASKKYTPFGKLDEERLNKIQPSLKHYNQDIHRASFALAEETKRRLGAYISDEQV